MDYYPFTNSTFLWEGNVPSPAWTVEKEEGKLVLISEVHRKHYKVKTYHNYRGHILYRYKEHGRYCIYTNMGVELQWV